MRDKIGLAALALVLMVGTQVFAEGGEPGRLAKADELIAGRKYEEAVAVCTEAVEVEGKGAGALSRRANSLFFLGKNAEALADIDRALAIDAANSGYYCLRGNIFLEMNDLARSKSDYEKAIALDQGNVDAYFGYGICHVYEKDMDAAIGMWKKCVEIDGSYLNAYRNLAMAYQQKRDDEAAIEYWSKCISLAPKSAVFYFERGRMYFNKNPALCIGDLGKAIELEPTYADAYWMRGFARKVFLRNEEAAKADYDAAVRLDPRYSGRPYPNW